MTPQEIRGCQGYPMADWLREIAAQLAELNENLRTLDPEAHLPEECRKHECSYYRHYLAYGPADLTHEGYHAAEVICEQAQMRMQEWMDNPTNDGKDVPKGMEDMCRRAEERVRA